MPPYGREHKARVQYELKRRGIRQLDVAAKLGVKEMVVIRVIGGTYPSATARGRATRDRVERGIAEMVGVPRAELFPHEAEGENTTAASRVAAAADDPVAA